MIEDQAIAQLRIPPHSVEAESSVLGGLLLEGSAWDRVGDFLADTDFYRHEHKLIFSSIRDLARGGKPVDAITVYEHLESSGKAEEAGGLPYLNSLAQFVMSAANIQRYAEIVREHSVRRRLVSAADEIASSAFNPNGQTIDSVVDAAQQKLLALSISSSSGDDWTSAYEGMVTHSELLERRNSGELEAWATGLSDLDEYLEGGFRPGELVIVGARPSMGKTALGLSIGVHMARERVVGFLSMEMSKQEVNDRLTAMLGHVSMSSVKRPRKGDGLQWGSVLEGVERAKELRLHISDQGGLNINQVRTKARNAKRLFGLQVLVVDYIGLMSGLDQRQNRNAQLGEISRGLKNLARELELAVVCLAQLNRKAEERSEQMPQMSDLRDSGEIEQDADVILFIKRPIMVNPELGEEWKNYAKLAVAKNRQGRCGHLDLAYIGDQTRFTSWGGPAPAKQQPASRKYRGGGL